MRRARPRGELNLDSRYGRYRMGHLYELFVKRRANDRLSVTGTEDNSDFFKLVTWPACGNLGDLAGESLITIDVVLAVEG